MAGRPNLVFQAHYADHLTPMLEAFNAAMPHGGDAPGLPPDPVFIERNAFGGGGSLRLLPSSTLLFWMAGVMANHEAIHREREAREQDRARFVVESGDR